MIDIKFLRENPDIVKENIKKKFQDHKLVLVDEVIELDKLSDVNYKLENGVLTIKPNNKYGKLTANTIKEIKVKKKKKKTTAYVSTAPWGEQSEEIYKVVIEEGYKVFLDPSAVGLFYNCKYCKEMDLRGLDTRFCTDMSRMFEGCASLEKINVEGWNTDKLTNTNDMFRGCDKLKEVIGAGEKVDTAFKSK